MNHRFFVILTDSKNEIDKRFLTKRNEILVCVVAFYYNIFPTVEKHYHVMQIGEEEYRHSKGREIQL